MQRAVTFGAAFALAFGGLAAQAAAQQPDPAANPPSAGAPAKDTADEAGKLKAGMVVKDQAGATIGRITDVSATGAGVDVNVEGKTVTLSASDLSVNASGTEAVTTKTKAELQARPASKPH